MTQPNSMMPSGRTKPLLLDLFCGAGGAAMGYHRAGFEVFGVDIAPQPNYPFDCWTVNALEFMRIDFKAGDFDAIHASPPCQHFTKYGNNVKDIKARYEDLLEPTRWHLQKSGLPYVIENVERAPLIDPVRLCGSMFDGRGTHDLQRHRLFESNFPLVAPGTCDHSIWEPNRYPGGRWKARAEIDPSVTPSTPVRKTVEIGRWGIPLDTQKWAMGVDWDVAMRELSEAVPPAYTEYIGYQLRAQLLTRTELAA